jgi:hypothetical protein
VGVEQKPIDHRSTSRPVTESGARSRAGAMRSTLSRTRTAPRWAPKREPERASCSRQASHRKGDRFGLVAVGQVPGGFFDQRHHVTAANGDHVGRAGGSEAAPLQTAISEAVAYGEFSF